MNRSKRSNLAKETVEILEKGNYTSLSGRTIQIEENLKNSIASTEFFDGPTMPECPIPNHEETVEVNISNQTTYAALRELSECHRNPGALNFASAKNPGGGFLNGSEAQEESLARSSTLYPTLRKARPYYDRNRANNSSLYLDLLIRSPEVVFFRNDDGELTNEIFTATIVTAPAPNAGAINRNEPEKIHKIPTTLAKRAEFVLRAFALANIETLVLGAWGCGVFQNDPKEVANAFWNLLKPGALYSRHFRKVTFAIYGARGKNDTEKAFREIIDR